MTKGNSSATIVT